MTDRQFERRTIESWVLNQWTPSNPPPWRVLLLVHGLSGDENSMSIFTNRLPGDLLLLSPRAIFPSLLGGYSWLPEGKDSRGGLEDFRESIVALNGLLVAGNFPDADLNQINLMGFSQGAALAYSFAVLHPSKTGKVAGISGYMPDYVNGFIESKPLRGKEFFVAHGKLDDLVTVDEAREAVEKLERAGASINYCEEDVGHKLSANCFRGIEYFFAK